MCNFIYLLPNKMENVTYNYNEQYYKASSIMQITQTHTTCRLYLYKINRQKNILEYLGPLKLIWTNSVHIIFSQDTWFARFCTTCRAKNDRNYLRIICITCSRVVCSSPKNKWLQTLYCKCEKLCSSKA
jgi:hypothetical protein